MHYQKVVVSTESDGHDLQVHDIQINTLLPKKNQKNLLNTDYKIIAKLIANRLKLILPSIINGDQTRYLKNRFIGENIRLLQDVTFFSEQTRNNIILLSIDFEKNI